MRAECPSRSSSEIPGLYRDSSLHYIRHLCCIECSRGEEFGKVVHHPPLPKVKSSSIGFINWQDCWEKEIVYISCVLVAVVTLSRKCICELLSLRLNSTKFSLSTTAQWVKRKMVLGNSRSLLKQAKHITETLWVWWEKSSLLKQKMYHFFLYFHIQLLLGNNDIDEQWAQFTTLLCMAVHLYTHFLSFLITNIAFLSFSK